MLFDDISQNPIFNYQFSDTLKKLIKTFPSVSNENNISAFEVNCVIVGSCQRDSLKALIATYVSFPY